MDPRSFGLKNHEFQRLRALMLCIGVCSYNPVRKRAGPVAGGVRVARNTTRGAAVTIRTAQVWIS